MIFVGDTVIANSNCWVVARQILIEAGTKGRFKTMRRST